MLEVASLPLEKKAMPQALGTQSLEGFSSLPGLHRRGGRPGHRSRAEVKAVLVKGYDSKVE